MDTAAVVKKERKKKTFLSISFFHDSITYILFMDVSVDPIYWPTVRKQGGHLHVAMPGGGISHVYISSSFSFILFFYYLSCFISLL